MGRVYHYYDLNGNEVIFAKRTYIGNQQMKMLFGTVPLPQVDYTIFTDEDETMTFREFIDHCIECVDHQVIPGLAG